MQGEDLFFCIYASESLPFVAPKALFCEPICTVLACQNTELARHSVPFASLGNASFSARFRISLSDSVLWKMLNFAIFAHERAFGDFYGKETASGYGKMDQWFYVFLHVCCSESTNSFMSFRWFLVLSEPLFSCRQACFLPWQRQCFCAFAEIILWIMPFADKPVS